MKGKLYKLRYNFFLSPEHDILALVGNGTTATVDSQSAAETDLTGLTNSTLASGVGFYALVMAHRRRTASCSVSWGYSGRSCPTKFVQQRIVSGSKA